MNTDISNFLDDVFAKANIEVNHIKNNKNTDLNIKEEERLAYIKVRADKEREQMRIKPSHKTKIKDYSANINNNLNMVEGIIINDDNDNNIQMPMLNNIIEPIDIPI